VPGGKWVGLRGRKIYPHRDLADADREADILRGRVSSAVRKRHPYDAGIQVIDALWFTPSLEVLRKQGIAANPRRRTNRRRNAKKPTYKAARLAIWKAFGDAGWTLSSPSLKVLHATSPWMGGKVRLWFKAQAILVDKGGAPWRMSNASSLAYGLDLRDVTDPAAFVRAVEKRVGLRDNKRNRRRNGRTLWTPHGPAREESGPARPTKIVRYRVEEGRKGFKLIGIHDDGREFTAGYGYKTRKAAWDAASRRYDDSPREHKKNNRRNPALAFVDFAKQTKIVKRYGTVSGNRFARVVAKQGSFLIDVKTREGRGGSEETRAKEIKRLAYDKAIEQGIFDRTNQSSNRRNRRR